MDMLNATIKPTVITRDILKGTIRIKGFCSGRAKVVKKR